MITEFLNIMVAVESMARFLRKLCLGVRLVFFNNIVRLRVDFQGGRNINCCINCIVSGR